MVVLIVLIVLLCERKFLEKLCSTSTCSSRNLVVLLTCSKPR